MHAVHAGDESTRPFEFPMRTREVDQFKEQMKDI